MTDRVFADRREAGRELATMLGDFRARDDVAVLGLARGGVPVAFEVARSLDAPLEVFTVRKIGAPRQEELALGAIATGGALVVNHEIMDRMRVPPAHFDQAAERARAELERRERAYRGDRPPLDLKGRTAILVDDGLATGATMRATVRAVRELGPERVVIAVPTAPEAVCRALAVLVDAVVCVSHPERPLAVGQSYADFAQTSDDEVRALLAAAEQGQADPAF